MRSPIAALAAALAIAACATGNGGPVRNDDLFARVETGMTTQQVERLAGRPDETMAFPMSNTNSWGYRYQDPWGYLAIFSVTFSPDGRVVSKLSRRVNQGGDHR